MAIRSYNFQAVHFNPRCKYSKGSHHGLTLTIESPSYEEALRDVQLLWPRPEWALLPLTTEESHQLLYQEAHHD